MDMELLLEELPWQILMCHIPVPVLVPRLGAIPRNIIAEIVDKVAIHWTASSTNTFWIGHMSRVAGLGG
jgi:hypothetical protein